MRNKEIEKKRIIRVFPRYSKQYTPDDNLAFVGMPPMAIPEHDEVHVCCTFTWDKVLCEDMAFQWEGRTSKPVKLGGVAYHSMVEDFVPGLYLRWGITFTSRGCNNGCKFCIVPKNEGKLRELPIQPGNWIQDNNFLQCSRRHKDKVFEMLKTQRAICFKGGLEPGLIDDHFVNAITGLRIAELWLACDADGALSGFKRACAKLGKAGFNREKIKCYALIGDNMDKNEARLRQIYEAGAMPFAQLYREYSDEKTEYGKDWNAFARMWQRPAALRAHMEKGTDYHEFRT